MVPRDLCLLVFIPLHSPSHTVAELVWVTNGIQQKCCYAASDIRLWKKLWLPSWWRLIHTTTAPLPPSLSLPLLTLRESQLPCQEWRGPRGEEPKPLANSYWGTEACQQPLSVPGSGSSHPGWTLQWFQPSLTAWQQPHERPWARTIRLSRSCTSNPEKQGEVTAV